MQLAPGLTTDEVASAEQQLGVPFPPDLLSLLQTALPISPRFPDWRQPRNPEIGTQLAQPLEGIKFDIEHDAFWWPDWGPRPDDLDEAVKIAEAQIAVAPKLIPIYGHRYLPAEPNSNGNPVFSVHQTDIIYYGKDLRFYIAHEFGGLTHAEAVAGEIRSIRFWSALIDWASH